MLLNGLVKLQVLGISKVTEHERELKRLSTKRYYEKHKEALLLKNKEYREKYPEKRRETMRQYKLKNSERIKKYNKTHKPKPLTEEQKKQRSAYNKQYRAKNKIQLNEKRQKYLNNNPHQYIALLLRTRIISLTKRARTYKQNTLLEVIGCSLQELKAHIEKQFTHEMSWEKHNFHIDHVIPCALFDLTLAEQQRSCFHYSNLRPLNGIENQNKAVSLTKEALPLLAKLQPAKLKVSDIPQELLEEFNEGY